jgi:hypothetical protein
METSVEPTATKAEAKDAETSEPEAKKAKIAAPLEGPKAFASRYFTLKDVEGSVEKRYVCKLCTAPSVKTYPKTDKVSARACVLARAFALRSRVCLQYDCFR